MEVSRKVEDGEVSVSAGKEGKLPFPQPFAPCLPSASNPTGVRNKTVGHPKKKREKKAQLSALELGMEQSKRGCWGQRF